MDGVELESALDFEIVVEVPADFDAPWASEGDVFELSAEGWRSGDVDPGRRTARRCGPSSGFPMLARRPLIQIVHLVLLVAWGVGCQPDAPIGERPDAGSVDAGSFDAGTIDAGVADAGWVDAGGADAGMDGGMIDAGSFDAGSFDAGSFDAGVADAGPVDAGGVGCVLSIAPSPSPYSGTQGTLDELAYVENAINTDNGTAHWKFGAVRLYASWSSALFNSAATPPGGGTLEQQAMASGHGLLLSIKPMAGQGALPGGQDTTALWNFIAAGSADADLAQHVSQLQALVTSSTWNPGGALVYLTYHHEPDGDGAAASYVAMFRHVVDYFEHHMSAAGRARIRWVWDPTTYGFTAGGNHRAPSFYPGDAYVDDVAADGYNRMPANNDTPTAHAGTYSSFGPDAVDPGYDNGQSIFDDVVKWTRANTGGAAGPSGLPHTAFGAKPLQIWEWGCWPMVVPPANFPGGANNAADLGTGALSAAAGASDTTLTLAPTASGSSDAFPKTGPYAVVIDPGTSTAETVTVGVGGTRAVGGNALMNLQRAHPRAHASGATVVLAEDTGDGTGTGMRARFIAAAADQLQHHWTDIKLISYFDSTRGAGILNQEWTLYTRLSVNESGGTAWVADPDSLKAFSDLARRPYFGGP